MNNNHTKGEHTTGKRSLRHAGRRTKAAGTIKYQGKTYYFTFVTLSANDSSKRTQNSTAHGNALNAGCVLFRVLHAAREKENDHDA
jgi:hypothetical protein